MIQGRGRRRYGGRARDMPITTQVALSLVLVAGAVLFARSFAAARALDVGFDARDVLAVELELRNHGYDEERGRAFLQTALDRLAAVPGISRVTTSRMIPFYGEWTTSLRPWPEASFAAGQDGLPVGLNVVGDGYFDVVGIPMVAGRPIRASDHAQAEPVVVINEAFAHAVYGRENAVGRLVPLREGLPPFRIVGVARNATYYELGEEPRLQAYVSAAQLYQSRVTFLAKTVAEPTSLIGPVRSALLSIDPNLAFRLVGTLQQIEAEQVAPYRATAQVVGVSGLIALLLACAGLYGVMAYGVAERTREIGVRMALGATRRSVARDVVVSGMTLASLGAVLGVLGALALARLVRGLLFGIAPNDAVSLTAAPVLLLAVATCALVVPALRAMRTDPTLAMREE